MSEDLLWGIKNGERKIVEEIINKQNVDQELLGGRCALHYAADYGQTDIINCLLKVGADINKPDKHEITPLLAAIWEDHTETVKLLLSKGADKNGVSPEGKTYLECAETDDMKKLLM